MACLIWLPTSAISFVDQLYPCFKQLLIRQVKPNIKLIDDWNPLLKDFVIRREKTILGILSSSSTMNVVLFSCLHLFHWSPTSCGECRKIQSSHPKPWQVIEYIDQKLQKKCKKWNLKHKQSMALCLRLNAWCYRATCIICFRSQTNTCI